MRRNKNRKRIGFLFKLVILALIIVVISNIPRFTKNEIYPKLHNDSVTKYSEEYNIDENFVYAIIKTESNFNTEALSEVGARGLMQIMEDAFEWSKLKISDSDVTYDDMFNAELNIKYGCFMLGYYYEKYGSYELTAAAYHSGMGQVDEWLEKGTLDNDKIQAEDIPTSKTSHYVKKVMRAYNAYNNLYK